jgi:hypothetical protein
LWPYGLGELVVGVYGFYHHFCRNVYLVSGNVCRLCEVLYGEKGFILSCSCDVVSELVEVYEGFRYGEEKGGMISSGGVCICMWRVVCKVSYLWDFR